MSKFKVGDKVRISSKDKCRSSYDWVSDMGQYCGEDATITAMINGGSFKLDIDRFTLDIDGGKWYWYDGMFEPIQPIQSKIVITTKGAKTLARLYEGDKVVKSAEAKCCPDDKFDFKTGAELVMDRLFKDKVESTKQDDVVRLYCVKDYGCPFFNVTKSKVYEFKNGRMYYDNNEGNSYSNYKDWCEGNPGFASCLIPLIKRLPKVGEWVYINAPGFACDKHIGKIVKISNGCWSVEHAATWCDRGDEKKISLTYQATDICCVLEGYNPEPEKPKYYNGKVVCVKRGCAHTVGKVYEVKNGIINDDSNGAYNTHPFKSLEELNHGRYAQFIEFKGER